jgi:hypothetical protein
MAAGENRAVDGLAREDVFRMLRERIGADDAVLEEMLAASGGDLNTLLALLD